jgi:hypothetical protein
MTETLPAMSPPNNTDKNIGLSFPDDELREIADQISRLTLIEATRLSEYISLKGTLND